MGWLKTGQYTKDCGVSEARFVAAGANKFSRSQQRDIFDSFSKFRIYNCIIVSGENYDIYKKYSSRKKFNDVDTGMKLGMHTWFPYSSSDRCTEVNDITLMDSWIISAQGHFTKNTDLFPGKISKNLNGCPLKAIVRDGKWNFSTNYVKHKFSNGSVVWYIEGVEYELLRVVLHRMNTTLVHVPKPETKGFLYNLYSAPFEKDPFIGLGAIVKTSLLNSYFDSTNSYYFMSYRWYVPCSIKYPR